MAALINSYAARELMLPKSVVELHRAFREFIVVTDAKGALLGCGGLRVYHAGLAEIVGLAVAEAAQGKGIGGRILETLLEDARALSIPRVFAMTLQERLFEQRGFMRTTRSVIPEKLQGDCASCDRRFACRETAVSLELAPSRTAVAVAAAGAVRHTRPERQPLRVLQR
jgi:N-acetylglutamate synthase-like GNAT family acetyltransferase